MEESIKPLKLEGSREPSSGDEEICFNSGSVYQVEDKTLKSMLKALAKEFFKLAVNETPALESASQAFSDPKRVTILLGTDDHTIYVDLKTLMDEQGFKSYIISMLQHEGFFIITKDLISNNIYTISEGYPEDITETMQIFVISLKSDVIGKSLNSSKF